MSTFNGEKYLLPLLLSLYDQKGNKADFSIDLFIRDDGSTDGTREIVNSFSKISCHFISGENLGPAMSFITLISCVPIDFDFYFFCDQDDIWKKSKIYDAITMLTKFGNNEQPCLYYCGLEVVDKDLKKITEYHKKCTDAESLLVTLAQGSLIPGCTMAFNPKLMSILSNNLPEYFGMHDSWAHLECLLHNGMVYCDNKCNILYRQHENNAVGMKKVSLRNRIHSYKKRKNVFSKCYKELLLKNTDITLDKRMILSSFANYSESFYSKLRLINTKGLHLKFLQRIKFDIKVLFSTF